MVPTFKHMRKFGSMLESDYPYVGYEQSCGYDEDAIVVKVKDYIEYPQDAYFIREGLKQGPMSIAMAFGDKLFNYSSGVIPADDDSWCADWLNHAIVLVGYEPGATSTK